MNKPIDDPYDLIGELPNPASAKTTLPKHGGKRAGAGQKTKVVRDVTEESHVKYAKARADKEAYLAKIAEHNFNVESKLYVPRSEVQRAAALAFATVTQTIRSIPDNLERKLGLAPSVSEQIAIQIDEIMGDLADDLEKMHVMSTPAGSVTEIATEIVK